MGSKQALSNGREPEELTELVEAFQLQNNVRIVVTLELAQNGKKVDLQARGEAWSLQVGLLDQKPSVLASATLWGSDYVRLMGLLTRLLYVLDFKLGEQEWAGVHKNAE